MEESQFQTVQGPEVYVTAGCTVSVSQIQRTLLCGIRILPTTQRFQATSPGIHENR
jgi:hypothetical protein